MSLGKKKKKKRKKTFCIIREFEQNNTLLSSRFLHKSLYLRFSILSLFVHKERHKHEQKVKKEKEIFLEIPCNLINIVIGKKHARSRSQKKTK